MTVHLWDHRLTWVAVPKAACTSIKHAFFEVENGFAFRDFQANGSYMHIHKLYPTLEFASLPRERIADHRRLAVLRDPVQRLISCFTNRVIYYAELSARRSGPVLEAAGLPLDPDLGTFIDHLAGYRRAIPSISHHAAPQSDFLGTDPAYFDHVHTLADLDGFAALVRRCTGKAFALERLHDQGPKIPVSELTARQIDQIHQAYAADYAAWGKYF